MPEAGIKSFLTKNAGMAGNLKKKAGGQRVNGITVVFILIASRYYFGLRKRGSLALIVLSFMGNFLSSFYFFFTGTDTEKSILPQGKLNPLCSWTFTPTISHPDGHLFSVEITWHSSYQSQSKLLPGAPTLILYHNLLELSY